MSEHIVAYFLATDRPRFFALIFYQVGDVNAADYTSSSHFGGLFQVEPPRSLQLLWLAGNEGLEQSMQSQDPFLHSWLTKGQIEG